MSLPVAVSPSVKSPGTWLIVNLKAGAASPGSAPKKALIMAVKSAAGTITADSQLVEAVAGEADAGVYLGIGTHGHLAAKRLFEEYGLAQVDLVAAAEPAGEAATGTFTFATAGASNAVTHAVYAWVSGRQVGISWAAGETAAQGAAKLTAAINALLSESPVTAADGGTAVCTATHRTKGLAGNDVRIRCLSVGNGTGDTVTASDTNLAGGTLEPVFTTDLTLIEGKEYDIIVGCFSNAEMYVGTSGLGPGKLKANIESRVTGASAKLQQAVCGATGALASIKTGAGALDYERMQIVYCLNGESLPCEFAGAEAGARLLAEGLKPNYNRIGQQYKATLYGCASAALDYPTDVEVEDALNTGVSIVNYDTSGNMFPARPITSYHKDSTAAPDDRVLDTARVTSCDAIAKDLRVNLPREFKGANLIVDILPGQQEPPPDTVQEKDVKAFVDSRMQFWISKGVARSDKYAAALADGTFAVQVDETDPAQCNIVLPTSIVPPLAKFSLIVNHFAT